jgi:ribosomal protein S18 acetylase RimI-like enzyme
LPFVINCEWSPRAVDGTEFTGKAEMTQIRTFADSDLGDLVDLTIATFGPFYEDYVRALLGPELFEHQHGQWQQDYREQVPTLHDPAAGRHVAVAEAGAALAGYVAWQVGPKPHHGEISMLAVASEYRREHVGRDLCMYAIEAMRAADVHVVGIGTGDDAFHAAARELYEQLGFTKIPIAGYLKRI